MIVEPVTLGEPNHEVNYIAGGFAGGGCSNSARKKHLRAIQSAHATTRRRPHIPPITFTDDDFTAIAQDDPMVITVEIDKFAIAKTLVDQGSSVDILYWEIFKKMRISEADIQPYNEQIVGFSGERVDTKGYIDLYTTFGEEDGLHKTINVRYLLVNAQTSYNILLGRPSINRLKAIVSTPHLAMKFPSANDDIATIHVDQKTARECYVASLKSEPTRRLYTVNPDDRFPQKRGRSPTRHSERRMSRRHMIALVDLDPRMDDPRMEAGEHLHPFPLRDDRHVTHIGTSLKSDDRKAISTTLVKNADLFAWTAADMPGVDPRVITHRLSLYKEARPIAQKKRNLGEERRKAACDEADKLLQAGFIRKAHYTTWLANVVMVKKANRKWRMCVDYTDLNKACSKDSYPLPTIDRLNDGAARHHILSFFDAYSGYNQIQMHSADRKKTAFMTDSDNFYYEVMPFGLKNAGATYQRLMDHVVHDMIGRNVEVCVDDIVVKSDSCKQHVADLKEVFQALRQHQMRLNPDKCAFGVEGGKF